MNDTYIYELDGNLYINLTNKCSNRCDFCVRDGKTSYYGHKLWLKNEPTAKQVIDLILGKKCNQVVFCGFGEPTYKLAEMLEIAKVLKENGYFVRLNTNGHGNLINGKDIVPLMKGLFDSVNVSLNAPDVESYSRVCHPAFKNAFKEMISFAVNCKNNGINANFSIVDCIGETAIKRCQLLADSVGVPLKIREMIEDSDAT